MKAFVMTVKSGDRRGQVELAAVRNESRALYWAVGLFSFFVNLLMLTGSLYMLNVYDRVLGSRSFETLLALSVIVAFLYTVMGILDYVRGRVMVRVGARFQSSLERRVFGAVLRATTLARAPQEAASGLRDLEAVQRLMASPALLSLFDLPWVPVFICVLFLFHPSMGLLAIGGTTILLGFALIHQFMSLTPSKTANTAVCAAERIGSEMQSEGEQIQAFGMQNSVFDRWQMARRDAMEASILASDTTGTFASASKAFRLVLQSAMLWLGAYLVLLEPLSPGAMIAAAILLGRALAPVEILVGQWSVFQRGREGWLNLVVLLGDVAPEEPRTALPAPKARLVAKQVSAIALHGQRPCLRNVSFTAEPGQAIGVIGPSGSGKSTLARLLTGVWAPVTGEIRLDGATLDQYSPEVLGQHIGYLPQRVRLFEGSIRENIARMAIDHDDAKVVAAAKAAAAHDMILKLPNGYDTMVNLAGDTLSGGQIQRIGLARAL